jgi:Ca2+/Na+ antiporter
VILGSNAFNIATLLGIGALVAGFIALHRRVVAMNGAVAAWVALACVLAVFGVVDVAVALALSLAVFVPYLALLGGARFGLPRGWSRWLATAVGEEEAELEPAIHPRRGGPRDAALALGALAVVVGASVLMEHEATTIGSAWSVAPILIGALVLAAVTSLPNAVAGIYLAARGRGAASLSTALNSNLLNVIAGLLVPGAILGLGRADTQTTLITLAYVALTALALAAAYAGRGLGRVAGVVLVLAYLGFSAALLAST